MVKNTKNKRLSNFLDKMIGGRHMVEQINRTKEILNNFDATNNGVIYIKENQLIGGAQNAANEKPLNTCAIVGYSEDPISICSNKLIVHDFNHLKNFISAGITHEDEKSVFYLAKNLKYGDVTSNLKIDDILINFYVNNKRLPGINERFYDTYTDILGPNLKNYIINNNKKKEIVTNTLKYDNHGKFELSKLKKVGKDPRNITSYTIGSNIVRYNHEGEKEWVQDFSHNGYNKDIVQAYEKNFIENIKNLPKFIEKQYKHIGEMTITDKIVINDYTKKSCFHFYLAYASKLISREGLIEIMKKDGNWIDGYKIDEWYDDDHNKSPQLYGFGDSFFKQILKVIGINRFNLKIIEELNHPGYASVNNIEDYWNFLIDNEIERVLPNDISIFSDSLSREEWDEVMREFITDIDEIIAKAPPTESVIYCYRAVTFDYIDLHKRDEILNIGGPKVYRTDKETYINTRIGSLSLNYDSSVRYLKTNEITKRKTGTMYRAYIMDGVKVLYIPSLSYASDEFEILHGSYGIFVDKKENYKCYNNKKNKYGILSYEDDQFNSAIVGLAGYSDNIKSETFEEISSKLQELLESVKVNLENPENTEPPETSENTKKSLKKIYEKFKASKNKSDAANEQINEFNRDPKVDLVENNADTLENDVIAIKQYYEAIRKARAAREAAQVRGGAAKKGVAKRGAAKKGVAKRGAAKTSNRIF